VLTTRTQRNQWYHSGLPEDIGATLLTHWEDLPPVPGKDDRWRRLVITAEPPFAIPGVILTTPGGRLVFHVFAALAEFIRELIVEGTREGLEAARARGRVGGRPVVMTPEKIVAARSLLPDNSISAIARMVGVSRGTLYAHMSAITTPASS
jgi:hypothetical protein